MTERDSQTTLLTVIAPTIVVDISEMLPKAEIEYAILCDRTIAYIRRFVDKHPNVFVFPFYTRMPTKRMDFSKFSLLAVMRPFFVGDLHPMKSAIDQIVNMTLGDDPAKCLIDESEGLHA